MGTRSGVWQIHRLVTYIILKCIQEDYEKLGSTQCVKFVLNYCHPTVNTQRLVAFDNFFTTYRLMRKMLSDGLYTCGTLRGNRSGLPEMLINKKLKLERGEFSFETKSGVGAVRWKDDKDATLLSTFHNPKDVVFVTRKMKDGSKETVSCQKWLEHTTI